MLFPNFLTFLANNAAIGVLALVAWVFIVGTIVWLGEKAVEKFRQRLSKTATPADASISNSVAGRPPCAPGLITSDAPGASPDAERVPP